MRRLVEREYKRKRREEGHIRIEDGDIVNLSDILFTQTTDYLIKYKDNQRVRVSIHSTYAYVYLLLYISILRPWCLSKI